MMMSSVKLLKKYKNKRRTDKMRAKFTQTVQITDIHTIKKKP